MALGYEDWKKLAGEHLAHGRVIDAFACFGKASRIKPNAPAPRMGMAEALWRLNRPGEAVAAWRDLARQKPDFTPAWLALAEANVLVGDFDAAHDAASRVLQVHPGNARVALLRDGAALADPTRAAKAARDIGELLQDPDTLGLLQAPALASAVAQGLARAPRALGDPLRARIATLQGLLPLPLVAEVAALLDAATLQQALSRDLPARDIEALRVLALRLGEAARAAQPSPGVLAQPSPGVLAQHAPARHGASAQAMLAQAAAQRYAALAALQYAPQVPVAWQVRGAGARCRAIVLVDAVMLEQDASRWQALAAALAVEAPRLDIGFAVFGDAQRMVDALAASRLVARVTQLPGAPDAASARALAGLDPDLVVDATALARPVGEVLAQRPARRIVALASSSPVALAPPLVDAVLPAAGAPLREALAREIDAALAAPSLPLPAADLHATLDAAVASHRAGRLDEAAKAYDALVEVAPWNAQSLYLRGTLRHERGDAEGAAGDFAATLALAPRDARAAAARVQLLLARHRVDEAREAIDVALAAHAAAGVPPVALMRASGHVALAAHDGPAAINAFAQAIAAEPFDAETHYNQGVAFQLARFLADAARAYQRALDLDPALVAAHFNLGVVFDELGETDASVAALEYVLSVEPRRADAHRALLNVLARHERGAQWKAAFQRFERECPDALGLVANALEFYQYHGNYVKVHQYVERLARGDFKPASETDLVDSLEQLLYLMLFFDIAQGVQYSLYATYDTAARHVYGLPVARNAQRKPGRLRVGYLSADLRDHVMGRMMLDVVRHHDRAAHEVLLFSTSAAEDAVTGEFRAHADAFVPLAAMSDADAVAAIDAADLDILVDLSTHTRGARPGIVARKPARVAITHVASAGAMGLSAVDFKLTDAVADLEGSDRFYVEKLLRMEGCAYPLRRIAAADAPQYARAALGIAADSVVIGAFVTPLKLSRRTTALWREVLERIPGAVLAFSPNAAWLADAYPDILRAAGIDAARIVWVPQGGDEAVNLARYRAVDLVLDPMPFGNVNGTIEPLSMGVPVVTLAGSTHGERLGCSILTHLGETRTVAQTGREYVDIAARLATDAAFMADVRASLRQRVAASPAFDAADYTRRLETAYAAALGAPAPDTGRAT